MTKEQKLDRQLKILIVDDDAFFRQLLNRILSAAGYKVIETSSVGDAICALNQLPDLAIIDYLMPGSDGANFIKELRANYYRFPIVFCSGAVIDNETFASMVKTYQVDMIIQKPIHPEMFVQQIAELFEPRYDRAGLDELEAELEQNQQTGLSLEEKEKTFTENKQLCEESLHPELFLPETEGARAIRETEEAIAELGSIYLLELPNELEQMTAEILTAEEKGDASSLAKASYRAHQIKGTSGSLGFDALSQIGSAIEKQLIALGKLDLTCADLKWQEILALVEQARAWIEKKQAELNSAATPAKIEITDNTKVNRRVLPPRVLIVASDQELIGTLTSGLEQEQMAVTSLSSSMEAFSVLDDFQPEIVLLQETMPSVSGNDICRMIRCNSRWKALPLLILVDSKGCTAESRQKLFEAGANDFILTPLAHLELLAKIKLHLGLPATNQQVLTF
jgi:DNA-binding response OmpR family regulator/HPt (histidine-containing phosphotransfer) domain-containing protein